MRRVVLHVRPSGTYKSLLVFEAGADAVRDASETADAQAPPPPGTTARLEARPVLGGVHHDYRIAA